MSLDHNVCLQTICVQYLRRPEEGTIFPGVGVTGGCEQACRCWEFNRGLLEDEPLLLTAEPSVQSSLTSYLCAQVAEGQKWLFLF